MLSDTVGEQITTWRKRRGWTREDLAKECASWGMPQLTHAVLTNIESGRHQGASRRRTVTVDEWATIALALQIPPILLLVPFPGVNDSELSPDIEVTANTAVRWFRGDEGVHRNSEGMDFWANAVRPLELLQLYYRAEDKLRNTQMEAADQRRVTDAADQRFREVSERKHEVDAALRHALATHTERDSGEDQHIERLRLLTHKIATEHSRMRAAADVAEMKLYAIVKNVHHMQTALDALRKGMTDLGIQTP